jgi:hypothetical protein
MNWYFSNTGFCKCPKTEGVLKLGSLDIFNELKRNFPLEMAGIRSSDVARALPGFANRVHRKGGNIYFLMRRA